MAAAASEPHGTCWELMPQAASQLLRRRGCETASDVAFMFGDQNAVRKFCKERALNDEDDICIMVAACETASTDAEIQTEATRAGIVRAVHYLGAEQPARQQPFARSLGMPGLLRGPGS